VKINNTTSILVRFENKNVFYCHEKRSSLIQHHNAGVVVLNSEVMVLVPGANPTIASYNATVVKIYSAVNSIARF
jgi:hypothetical protein